MYYDGRNSRFGIGGGKRPLNIDNMRGMSVCFDVIVQRGDEDEGRAGRVRRKLSSVTERATEVARGILGRLRRRG
jgi:hypothetical protein